MARKIPNERFDDLVRVATDVFISQGYVRAQMADIASELGVAKGTLYGYVESKEALLYLCVLHAGRPGPVRQPESLPVATPKPGALERLIRRRISGESLPLLQAAVKRRRATDIRSELEAILRESYDTIEANHRGIKLVDRLADHAEIAAEWQARGRTGPRELLETYLASRARARQLRPIDDPRLTARFVIEAITTWAMHIKWDPAPQGLDPRAAEDQVIDFLMRGLLPGGQ